MVLFALVFFAFVLPATAATLSDYHRRLDAARMDAIALRRLEDESGFQLLKVQKIDEIRTSVPATEPLDWQGGSVETNNQWLHDNLEAYLKESDARQRKTILLGMEERLQALAHEIDDVEQTNSSDRTKDEDKQKLSEILRREEYQKPEEKEESLFQRWSRGFQEWLSAKFPSSPVTHGVPSDFGSFRLVLQILVYAAVIGSIALLLYRFRSQLASRFGYKPKEKKRERVILGERIADDESADDLFGEAERLARDGQLRDAIRKGYIALLCELSDRKIIGLARHKTNRDYLRDVRKRVPLFESMSGATGTYERNWYGLRPSEPDDWEDFRNKYKETMASART